MPKYYPILVDLENQPCLVVGGGIVAYRKIEALLSCQAQVTVVAPEVLPEIQALADQGRVTLKKRPYQVGDVEGMRLVISATDDRQVNAQVSQEAQARGIPVNVVDDPELCSFIVPSILQREGLILAVSTSGASPALAKYLRLQLEQEIGPEYGRLVRLLAQYRPLLKEVIPEEEVRAEVLSEGLRRGILDLLRENRFKEAEELLKECILSRSALATELHR